MTARTLDMILLLPLLAVLACAPGEQAQQEAEGGMEAATEGTMMGATSTVTLAALNNSGITGTAEITHSGDAVTIVLEMSGLNPGDYYPAHIHEGSCEQPGGVVAALKEVPAASDGMGSSTTELSMSEMMGEEQAMGEMGEGEHPEMQAYVQVHSPGGTPAACANVKPPAGDMM